MVVGAKSDTLLGTQIASSMDGQTISVDCHHALSDLSITRNLTLAGKGNESILDLSKMDHFLEVGNPSDHKSLLLRNLVIKDCLRIHAYAGVVAENCRFENASLDVMGASLYARDCVFTGGRIKTYSDEGGALNLYESSTLLDDCSFLNDNAFLNASASEGPNYIGGSCDGGSGGAIFMTNSSVVLLNPIIDSNFASSAGGICLVNSDLVVRDGRITNNRALPINYTNPVDFFSGEGGAISAVEHSTVMPIDTLISGNRARKFPAIDIEDGSEVKQIGARIVDNREL
jgi:hypothetical protein